MRNEISYRNQMKEKAIEAINNNEFDMFLMGDYKYLIQSRELPQIQPGTGNLYDFTIVVLYDLQNDSQHEMDFGLILLNSTEQLIYKGIYGLYNSVEIIRSILNSPKESDLLGIKSENLRELTKMIKKEICRMNKQLKDTMSPNNSKMSLYECLEFYNGFIYEHIGTKLIENEQYN